MTYQFKYGFSFYAFILFFGVALLEGLKNGRWLLALAWLVCAMLFLYADTKHLEH